MSDRTIQDEIASLSAKVAALTLLVEALYVDDLSREVNAAAIGDAIVKSALDGEAKARDATGDDQYAVQITEALTSLIDRAVMRAVAARKRRRSRNR
jgi:hypothetical protein